MQYLEKFRLASADAEDSYVLSYPYKLEMGCYSHTNIYPFKIFPQKSLCELNFAPITIFYGGNGSGKSTLLNVICQKLGLERSAPFNNTPFFEEYLELCSFRESFSKKIPKGSKLIASDDVFDYLLDVRAINEGIDDRRVRLFEEYEMVKKSPHRFDSLDDYDRLKKRNEVLSKTKSAYVSERLGREVVGRSNGESAFAYFTHAIGENALYLLDEPENSLSVKLQEELAEFIENSVRFYGCQFIISTHSPFMLSMRGAKIYDLDSVPVSVRKWTELENVRIWREFFKKHEREF